MKLLFATDRLHVPDDFSGSVQSTHALVNGLRLRGHDCLVLASLPRRTKHFFATGIHRVSLRRVVLEWVDTNAGYPVRRGSYWRFAERLKRATSRYVPDVLVLDSLRALFVLSSAEFRPRCPIFLIVHDTSFINGTRDLPYKEQLTFIANSPYTASKIAEHFSVRPEVISPIVEFQSYATERPDPVYLTLVSPHPRKGLDLVLTLAEKLPSFQFQLIEGWPMDTEQWKELSRRVSQLQNVTLRRSVSDMRVIYRETWALLVPSELETFGRVVVEAQASGIPALCNDVGALRWVAGEGAVLFSPNANVSVWVARLEQLRDDIEQYNDLSRKAVANTLRLEFQPKNIVERFEATFFSRPN